VYLFNNHIKEYIKHETDTLNNLNIEEINTFMNILLETIRNDGKIYICGNGGSAATASHFANDFNKGVNDFAGNYFNFICLNDNVATLTAIANDISYEDIYYHQLINRLKPNDIVIGISGSGNSKNIVKALEYANTKGNTTVALIGYDGGKLKTLATHFVHIPICNMQIVEDLHMVLDHMIMFIFNQLKEE
jgi:D-sedoheptulose 7-phosphate isomerase